MLDTVLQIGKTFRNSPDGLKYHRYIFSLTDKQKEKVVFYTLPVLKDYSFDFENCSQISDENLKQKLFFIKFKTSDYDTAIKYVFGDIYYGLDKNRKEYGNYGISKDSIKKGMKYIKNTKNEVLLAFINSFIKNKDNIHNLLQSSTTVFLHFDFGGKHWYETDAFSEINKIMINNFTEVIDRKGLVFKSMLYRTLCSGDEKNDRQFPSFTNRNKYKSRLFNTEDIKNLFYGINYTEKPAITPYNFHINRAPEKIKIVILPKDRDEQLTAKDYEDFSATREDVIKASYELKDNDWLFSPLLNNVVNSVIAFDVIFVKEGARTQNDILEICGIEKSYIKDLNDRINKIRHNFEQRFNRQFFIADSFLNIFDDKTKALKRYQNYLYKTLPKIYIGNYYNDQNLLDATIEKIELLVRNQGSQKSYSANYKTNELIQDFRFLTKIQNTLIEGENLMKILESQSYKLGLSLGIMARPFASWREDCPIKSFEKNYVGNLTRRIASLNDLLKLKVDIEQKLIMHEKTYPDIKEASLTLAEGVKSFKGRYDKNECAFGFFESYFTFSKKNENNS